MTESFQSNVQVYVRPSVREFGDMPLDTVEWLNTKNGLTPLQIGAYWNLRTSLWLRGALPVGLRALASVANVSPRTFERMAPALEPLFDRDADGRWRDYALEGRRGAFPALPPLEQTVVDPNLSAVRSKVGKDGANKRWGQERQRKLEVVGGSGSTDADGSPMANGVANQMANVGSGAAEAAQSPGSLMANATASLVHPQSQSDGLLPNSSEEIPGTDGRTDAPGAIATNGKPDSNDPAAAMAKSAHASDTAMANVSEPAIAKSPGEAVAPPASDAVIIAALRKAGGDKIPAMLLTSDGIAPVRVLLEIGCDLDRDIVPAFEVGTRGLREPLKSLRAGFLHKMATANRDQAMSTHAFTVNGQVPVFIVVDSPQWRAWLDHKQRKTFPTSQQQGKGPRGWFFETEWPPGVDPLQYAVPSARAARAS